MNAKPFLDTNIIIYAFVVGDARREKAQGLLADGGIISVQVLNEFVSVSRRKLMRDWDEIEDAVQTLRSLLEPVIPVTIEIHEAALVLSRNDNLAFYDALVVAAATHAKCGVLYSEDMQDGRKIGGLVIRNPFAAIAPR